MGGHDAFDMHNPGLGCRGRPRQFARRRGRSRPSRHRPGPAETAVVVGADSRKALIVVECAMSPPPRASSCSRAGSACGMRPPRATVPRLLRRVLARRFQQHSSLVGLVRAGGVTEAVILLPPEGGPGGNPCRRSRPRCLSAAGRAPLRRPGPHRAVPVPMSCTPDE